MKEAILIFALSRSPWIGGIYYKKNITHMLLSDADIANRYKIIILTNFGYSDVFSTFHPQAEIVLCKDDAGLFQAAMQVLRCCLRYRIKYIFPIMPYRFLRILDITPVSWIADFQHCHYPGFFSERELCTRNRNFRKIARADTPLILSSDNALEDFCHFFSNSRENVHVVHFTSYIEDESERLTKNDEEEILSRFGLFRERYIAVCNQFWKHKNHLIVLQAIKLLALQHPEVDLKVVFTGELSDRRDPRYIEEIEQMLDDPLVREHVRVLGFIDRISQLCIMKCSRFIVQPSLFEGWGTVVEDAKALDKKILLSDISVHREQMDEGCRLFDPSSPENLATAILDMLEEPEGKSHRPMDLTKIYAKALEEVFR